MLLSDDYTNCHLTSLPKLKFLYILLSVSKCCLKALIFQNKWFIWLNVFKTKFHFPKTSCFDLIWQKLVHCSFKLKFLFYLMYENWKTICFIELSLFGGKSLFRRGELKGGGETGSKCCDKWFVQYVHLSGIKHLCRPFFLSNRPLSTFFLILELFRTYFWTY